MVVVRHRAFLRALSGTDLGVVHRRTVSAGTLPLTIFILDRGQGTAGTGEGS